MRFLCVRLRLEKGMAPAEIAKFLGWNVNTVRMTQKGFIDHGILALIEPKRGGRRRHLMTLEKGKDFLSSFSEDAGKGLVLDVHGIKEALERKLGRAVHTTTVYRIQHRHGWRKVVSRKNHPKSDRETTEDFKKELQ